MEGQNPAELELCGGAEYTGQHGQCRRPEQDGVGVFHILGEYQCKYPIERIHPDLRQQSRKQCGYCDLRGVVRGREPEKQWECRRLDAKRHHEHQRHNGDHAGIFNSAHLLGDIRHVEGAHHAVQQADG